MKRPRVLSPAICLASVMVAGLPVALAAQSTTFSQIVGADSFVSSGQPTANFGAMGAMEIAAPTTAQPRTEMTLLRFDTAAMMTAFDTTYGADNWLVTDVTLSLFSNVASAGQQPGNSSFNRVAAGGFEFDLLSNNNWNETAITWATLPDILPGGGNNNTLTPVGTFFYPANGSANSIWLLNPDSMLVNAINHGGEVTLLGQPAAGGTVGYLFNTLTFNPGYLNVTVAPVPEPSTLPLAAGGAGVIVAWASRRKRSSRC